MAQQDSALSDTSKIFSLEAGERAAIVGGTGSGKTGMACFLLDEHPRAPVIVYDLKIEPKFSGLRKSATVDDMAGVAQLYNDEKIEYIIVRPRASMLTDYDYIDGMLQEHFNRFAAADCYIDELYTLGITSHPRPGINAMITRGRARGISVMTATQRPSWIPRITLSEAQHYYIFALNDRQDVKRMQDFIPAFEKTYYSERGTANLEKHGFFYYRPGEMDRAEPMPPVPLDARFNRGYVDSQRVSNIRWV